MEDLTFAMENYLEAVYELSAAGGGARVSDIAARLGVSKASVNSAMNVLSAKQLVENEKYREVVLTGRGRNLARMTANKHAILRCLLAKVMGVPADIADADACAMEHVISAASVRGILRFLEEQGLSPLAAGEEAP